MAPRHDLPAALRSVADGRWFAALILSAGARWDIGATYLSVSRLPWLMALVAWSTCGTWTRGLHFSDDLRRLDPGDPDAGDASRLRRRFGLAATPAETFAVERRTGWRETADTPARSPDDHWDERRADRVTMERARPADPGTRLFVRGRHAAFRDGGPAWGVARYSLERHGERVALPDIQWADWSRSGRLLVATRAGALEVRDEPYGAGCVSWRADLAALRPTPEAPPPEASRW
jgi:hypothetical protein